MFALDLFNNDHERRLAEGAVDQLEQRRIDDLAMKMDDLVARAKTATTPEVKQALMKEFQKCKAERDNYYKIQDECMGYGTLTGEGQVTPTATGLKHHAKPGNYGGYEPEPELKGLNKTLTKNLEKGMGVEFKRAKKFGGGIEVDETGIPGSVPAEKIPGKEALLRGRGRSYYEAQDQQKNSKEVNEDHHLAVGDPVIVTAPNEYEGKTGEIAEFGPSGKFVVVDLYNHGRHSMHLSDIEYNQYAADQEDEDDWYDDGAENTLEEAGTRAGALNTAQQLYKAIQSSKGKPQHEIDLLQRQLNALARKYQLKPEEYTAGANQQQAGGQQQRQQPPPPPPPPGGQQAGQQNANQQGNWWQQQYEKHYGQNAQQQQQANPDNIWNPQWAAKQQAAYRANGGKGLDPNWAQQHMDASAKMMRANQADMNKMMQSQMASGPWNMPGAKMAEDEVDEGFQDFNRVEPYAVCLAGKPVKKFDYYEDARRFHDNWKKKLYREGNKAKADKITLMPVMDESSAPTPDVKLELLKLYNKAMKAPAGSPIQKRIIAQIDALRKQEVAEAGNPAQQAAIAIAKKKEQSVAEGLSSDRRAHLDSLIDAYRNATGPEAFYSADDDYDDPDNIIAQIRSEFGDKIADTVEGGTMHFPRPNHAWQQSDPMDPMFDKSPRVTKSGKVNRQDVNVLKKNIQRRVGNHTRPNLPEQGVAEGYTPDTNYSYTIVGNGDESKAYDSKEEARDAVRKLGAGYKIKRKPRTSARSVKKHFSNRNIDEESSTSSEAVEIALIRRVLVAHTDLIMNFGLDKVTQAIEEVAYNVGDVDEIGTSDVSGWIHQVKQILGVE